MTLLIANFIGCFFKFMKNVQIEEDHSTISHKTHISYKKKQYVILFIVREKKYNMYSSFNFK